MHTYIPTPSQQLSTHTARNNKKNNKEKECMCTYTPMPEPDTTTQQTQPTHKTDNKPNNTSM